MRRFVSRLGVQEPVADSTRSTVSNTDSGSFNPDSSSSVAATRARSSRPRRCNSAETAAASVGATMAPISRPRIHDVEKSSAIAAPTIAAVAITPTVARVIDGHSARRTAPGSVRSPPSNKIIARTDAADQIGGGKVPEEDAARSLLSDEHAQSEEDEQQGSAEAVPKTVRRKCSAARVCCRAISADGWLPRLHRLIDLPGRAGTLSGLPAAGYQASPHNFIGRITIGMFRRCNRRSMVSAASLCNRRIYQLSRSKMSLRTSFGPTPRKRERFPLPRANGCCRFGQRTLTGASGNDEDAPISGRSATSAANLSGPDPPLCSRTCWPADADRFPSSGLKILSLCEVVHTSPCETRPIVGSWDTDPTSGCDPKARPRIPRLAEHQHGG